MSDTTSEPEPSELVKASPRLMGHWMAGFIPKEEIERRALGAQLLKEAFSSSPLYAKKAASDPDYWNELYGSRVNWWPDDKRHLLQQQKKAEDPALAEADKALAEASPDHRLA